MKSELPCRLVRHQEMREEGVNNERTDMTKRGIFPEQKLKTAEQSNLNLSSLPFSKKKKDQNSTLNSH